MLQSLFPFVKATAVNTQYSAKVFYAEGSREFKNYFEFLLFKGMNSLFAPTPFTSYPFFARNSFAFARISSLISSSFDIDIYVSMSEGVLAAELSPVALDLMGMPLARLKSVKHLSAVARAMPYDFMAWGIVSSLL